MEDILFYQMQYIRNATLKEVENVSESQVTAIPQGFNNNIIWNLGHIYLVQEKFSYHFAQEPMQLPEGFTELFGAGTKPGDSLIQPPPLLTIIGLLKEQPARIQQSFRNRLGEEVENPYTLSSGLLLKTIGEFLNFTLYHEGIHVQTIRMLKRFNN